MCGKNSKELFMKRIFPLLFIGMSIVLVVILTFIWKKDEKVDSIGLEIAISHLDKFKVEEKEVYLLYTYTSPRD